MKRKRHSPEQIIRKLKRLISILTRVRASPTSAEPWRFLLPPITAGSSCTGE